MSVDTVTNGALRCPAPSPDPGTSQTGATHAPSPSCTGPCLGALSRSAHPSSRTRGRGSGGCRDRLHAAPLAVVQRPRARRVRHSRADGADRHRADWIRQPSNQSDGPLRASAAHLGTRGALSPVLRAERPCARSRYEFKYSLTRKSRTFEDQFFRFLARTGTPGNPTVYQTAYNDQVNNLVDVTGPVLYIDGPTVERWLENNANPRTNGYTVYFINWYGRRDFKFHAYTRTGDPDPDTGFDFGTLQSSAMCPGAEPGRGAGSMTSRLDPSGTRPTGSWTSGTLMAMASRTTGCRRSGSTRSAATARRMRSATTWDC